MTDNKNDKDEVIWNIKVRRTLDELLTMAISKDTHSTKSEFIRQAVREKLEKMGVSFNIEDIRVATEDTP